MNFLKRFIFLYVDGFKNQSKVSRRLWLIILIKREMKWRISGKSCFHLLQFTNFYML
ncbi:MAG: DUF4492 domain-containing protein [Bacteroidales bacterium]|nr:DUF4492 domain-containing protein [Bacteroidales bacterium]